MIFEPGYTVFHCGTLKKKKGEWGMSDTPRTDKLFFPHGRDATAAASPSLLVCMTQYELLERENAALQLDAERYRWLPIDSAPRDNKRPLLLASFNSDDGTLQGMDYDGSWESGRESWEVPEVYWYWASAENNVEEPTHWMYQPDWYASIDAAMKEEGK
jgi:hypothetical protein